MEASEIMPSIKLEIEVTVKVKRRWPLFLWFIINHKIEGAPLWLMRFCVETKTARIGGKRQLVNR